MECKVISASTSPSLFELRLTDFSILNCPKLGGSIGILFSEMSRLRRLAVNWFNSSGIYKEILQMCNRMKTFLFPWCPIVVTVPAMRLTFTDQVMHTWWISPSSHNLRNRCMEIMVLYVSHNGNEIKFNEISICLIDHSCNEINELVYLIYLINSCNVGYRSCVPASRSTQLQWLDAQSQNKGCKLWWVECESSVLSVQIFYISKKSSGAVVDLGKKNKIFVLTSANPSFASWQAPVFSAVSTCFFTVFVLPILGNENACEPRLDCKQMVKSLWTLQLWKELRQNTAITQLIINIIQPSTVQDTILSLLRISNAICKYIAAILELA